jgi:chromatin remodeling complex protein RSC6
MAKKIVSKRNLTKPKKAASSAITAKLIPSKELSRVIGGNPISRQNVFKKVWDYIKSEGLNEGRIIYPDSTLGGVTGMKELSMFQLPGALNKHLTKA